MPILAVDKLKKVYRGSPPFTAVNEISFALEKGEILGLLGPNGSGKTTTIQMLLGTLTPSSGSILYFGKDFTTHRSDVLQQLAFASTYTHLPPLLTIEENLHVYGRLYGLTRAEIKTRSEPLLKRLGIFDKKQMRVSSLSAGQITRLMLVKAFFTHPKIVLLDEPTASLDPDMANEMCTLLLEQREQTGLSILFTSHKMQEATELCDRVIFLKQGNIIANEHPQKLAKSASAFYLRLVITDGLKRTVALAQQKNLKHQVDHRTIEISLDEKEIPPFLNALAKMDIVYGNIQIKEPSLEDYFLQIARNQL